jgi:hypothetical protein
MKKLLLGFIAVIITVSSWAQSSDPCGFDIVHSRLRTTNKAYDSAVKALDARWMRYASLASSGLLTYTSAGYVYEIPTVVHVIHTGGAVGTSYNPDSTKIAQMMEYLNKSYAAESPFPDTAHGGCRIPLKFVLAKRSPTGAATNGIVRVDGSSISGYTTYGINAATSSGVDPEVIAKLSRWPAADYYNVYSVNKIDGNDLYSTGGIAGFAYFPGYPYIDGMYVAASQIKSGSTTVSHEFGHAFSLYHTFEGDAGGTTCPSTSSCSTTGDLVCDTEPHIRESSAFPTTWCPPTDYNSCTGGSYNNTQKNIMDYTNCPPDRYTAGQRTRVLNTLDNERVGYKSSLGLTTPSGSITAATCIPSLSTKAAVGPELVTFNGMSVWTGASDVEDTGYVDHAYTQQTSVKRGSTYSISVTTKTNIQNVRVYIDYNNDGSFTGTGELVYSHDGTATSEVHTGSFTIPTTATTCTYLRMRVVSVFYGAVPTSYSCGPYTYGQAEDYGVYVVSDTPTATTPITYCMGATASALTATGSNLKWYTAATGGTGSTTAPTPSTASIGTTTYYVTQSGDGSTTCESDRKAIVVNVTSGASAPTATSPIAYCQGATASALTATGTALKWYTVATGGTGSSTAITPSTTAAGSTTYYVSQTVSGCESPRTAIVVNVTATPSAPTVTTPIAYCVGATASALTATGSGLLWYTASSGGTGSSTAITPSTASAGSNTYYVSQTVSGCESPRTGITVNVNSVPSAPTVSTPVAYCVGTTASALTATGTSLLWYTASTGGTGSSTAITPSTASAGSNTYYVSQTVSGCESPRAGITVNVNSVPSAPTVTTPVAYCVGATASALSATGTALKWYTVATGGTGSSTAITPPTSSAGSTNYYVSQTVSGCESPRATIAVNVNSIPSAPTVTTPVNYCVGATASALSATGTGLLWYTASSGGTGSSTAITPSTASAGTNNYYVSQTISGCESSRAGITVNVTSVLPAPVVTSPVNYCTGATASALTATGTNLRWYTVASGGTASTTAPTPSTASAGTSTYYVSQSSDASGTCEGSRASISVNVSSLVTATVTPTGNQYICSGSSLTLTGPSGATLYQWLRNGSPIAAATTSSYSANTSGTYRLVTGSGSCVDTSAATVLTVVPSIIYVDSSKAVSASSGASWDSSFKTLSEALFIANQVSCATEVWVKKGTYYPTSGSSRDSSFRIARNNLKVYGGFAGTETVRSARNWITNPTILSGDLGTSGDSTDNSYHVVTILGSSSSNIDTSTVLDGFTITRANGYLASGSYTYGSVTFNRQDGGGILLYGGGSGNNCSPTVSNCIVSRNAANFGGGIYQAGFSGGKSSGILRKITFNSNTAYYQGGGLFVNAQISGNTSGILDSSDFNSNKASWGGAIYYQSNSSGTQVYTQSNCNFNNNTSSTDGGGIQTNVNTELTITNNTFTGNSTNGHGGAGYLVGKKVTVSSSTFRQNSAHSGGAFEFLLNLAATFDKCVFYQNTAIDDVSTYGGGAIHADGSSVDTFTNCVFANNSTSSTVGYGGGAILASTATITLKNCTFSENTTTSSTRPDGNTISTFGGGAYIYPINTIIWGSAANHIATGGSFVYSYSLVKGVSLSSPSLSSNPRFTNPSSPAGVDGIFLTADDGLNILACSPAKNAGTTAPSTDAVGRSRVGTPDMGAYEEPGTALPTVPTVVSPVNYCQGATASALSATKSSATDTLKWYNSSLTYLGTLVTPSTTATGTTTYYVTQTNAAGCESGTATVTVTVNPNPSIPTATSPVNFCNAATSSALTATKSSASDTLKWYTVSAGGTGTTTAPSPSTSATGVVYYYVSQVNSFGCESGRKAIQVNINPRPDSVIISPLSSTSFCNGDSVTLRASAKVNMKAGTTGYFTALYNADGTTNCNCPSGYVAVGYNGRTGTILDGFKILCRQINRYGSLGTGTDSTILNGGMGGGPNGPYSFSGGEALVGMYVTDAPFYGYTLNSVQAFGQTLSYIKTAADPSLSPASLTTISGISTPYRSSYLWVPAGHVVTGMMSAPTGYSTSVALNYTPIGAFEYTYSWSTSDTADQIKVKTGGTYTVTATNALGCSRTSTGTVVTVNPIPTAPVVTSPVNYCQGAFPSPLAATKPTSTDTLLWYAAATGGTPSYFTPTPGTGTAGTTNYWVSAKSVAGCEGSRSLIAVTVNPTPGTPTVTSTVTYCQDDIATALTATKASSTDTLLWYTVATGGTGSKTAPTPSTTIPGTTTYWVSEKSTLNCEGNRTAINVVVNAKPSSPTVASVNYCVGATAVPLTATRAATTDTLYWYTAATGGTGSTTAPTPSTATAGTTTYYVSERNPNKCESPRVALTVTVNALPTAPTVTTPVNLCIGGPTAALTATGTSLKWYSFSAGGTGTTTAPTPSTAVAGTTIYYVSQTNALGCESPRVGITVNINSLPVAPTVVSPVTYCQGATAVALTATKPSTTDTLYWYTVSSGGTGTATAPIPSTATTGTTVYYVSAKSQFGCEGTLRAALSVNVNPTPTVPTVTTPVVYCLNATATALTATKTSASDTLKWYTVASGGTGSTTAPVPSTATAGTVSYYVSQRNAFGCESGRATISVTTNPLPAAPTVTTPVNLCVGGPSTTLTATGTALLWYTSLTGTGSATAPTPSTATAGTTPYYVTQTDATTGCESQKATINVIVNPLPAAPTVTSPVNLCIGSIASPLTATGTNLKWYTSLVGGTGSSTAPTPSTATLGTTNYYVSQTSSVGCEGPRATIAVTVQPLPTVSISPKGVPGFYYCVGKTVTLKATASTTVTYQWYRETTLLSGATFDTLAAGTTNNFKVVVTSVYGCKGEASVFVQQDTTTLPTMTPTENYICENGGVALLNCHPGYTGFIFDWIKDGVSMIPSTPKSNTRNVTLPGIYKVTVTNNYGCINTTNDVAVIYYPTPIKPSIVRMDPVLSLTPTSGYIHYQWYKNGSSIFGETFPSYTFISDGKYHAVVTDANGCVVNSDTINITNTSVKQIAGTQGTVKVYPNPTSGLLQIDAPVKVIVEVADLMGRRLIYQENAQSVNLGQLPDAAYVLRIYDENHELISLERISKVTQ